MLTLATLRLPVAFTALFALIDVALLLLIIATDQASTGLTKTAGYVVLVFAALGVYLFFSSASQATGGKALPLGQPIMGDSGARPALARGGGRGPATGENSAGQDGATGPWMP
jgi:GPR1/FUN34/yaaH family